MRGSGLSGHAEYQVLPTLAKWLAEERVDKGQLSQTTDWHQVTVKELPEQHDGGSCGVFTCMYAKCLLAGSDPTQAFSQNDIPRLRLQMAANLLKAYGLPNAKLPGDLSG
ncbi:TPA: SUMO1 sentrin specific peptidase 1 [Trebouxia sp. C0005]